MPDIDFGRISESLNEKSDRDLRNVDTTAKADAVIDFQLPTADNGYTWYRLYASGWVEQGGLYTRNSTGTFYLTLLIPMADTNYTTIMACSVVGRTSDFSSNWTFAPYSTTQCQIYSDGSVYGKYGWYVSGKAAN